MRFPFWRFLQIQCNDPPQHMRVESIHGHLRTLFPELPPDQAPSATIGVVPKWGLSMHTMLTLASTEVFAIRIPAESLYELDSGAGFDDYLAWRRCER